MTGYVLPQREMWQCPSSFGHCTALAGKYLVELRIPETAMWAVVKKGLGKSRGKKNLIIFFKSDLQSSFLKPRVSFILKICITVIRPQ